MQFNQIGSNTSWTSGWSGEHDHLGPESLVGGGLLRHHRGFLVGFQVMPLFAGPVSGSASALTSYLSSGAPRMVVHVKNIFPYLNKDRLRPFEYKLDTICNMQPHITLPS